MLETAQPTKYFGMEGEDPSAPPWGHGNYVGPYWSNGQIQESVEWGDKEPIDELDELARQHDAAYARFKDRPRREAADLIFATEARKLNRKLGGALTSDPRFAAAMVEYGNYAGRQVAKLASDVGSGFKLGLGPLAGVLKFGVDNIREMNQRVHGTHLRKELEQVRAFYNTDPRLSGKTRSTDPGQIKVTKVAREESKPVIDRGNRTQTHGSSVNPPPLSKAAVEPPNPGGPSEKLLWPSKQAKKFAKYIALRNASIAVETGQKPGTYSTKPKGGKFDSILPESYKKKKKKKRSSVQPL